MGPSIEAQGNAASPLAEDVIRLLHEQLLGPISPEQERTNRQRGHLDALSPIIGTGRFPEIQRQQGALDASAFGTGVGPLQREAGTAIRQFVESGGLPEQLMNQMNRATDMQAGDLREAFGIAGSRFGTPLAMGEGLMRADALANLGAEGMRNMLQGIQLMQTMGNQNIAPFLDMIGLGIPQAQFVEKPGFLDHLGSVVDIGRGGVEMAGGIKGL